MGQPFIFCLYYPVAYFNNVYYICMLFFSFLYHYLVWHYSFALVGYIRISRNIWWYLYNQFSIPQLTSTLFAPYKRQIEDKSKRFSLKRLVERIILNSLSRLAGFVIRISIILVGIFTIFIYTTLSIAGFAFWLGAPILIPLGFIMGIWFLLI